MTKLQEHLRSLDACRDALNWVADKSAREAWETCERADWLLEWASRTKTNDHIQIIRAACDCARAVLWHVPESEIKPRLVIEAVERWTDNPTEANRILAVDAATSAIRFSDLFEEPTAAWAATWSAVECALALNDIQAVGRVSRTIIQCVPREDRAALVRARLIIPWTDEKGDFKIQ